MVGNTSGKIARNIFFSSRKWKTKNCPTNTLTEAILFFQLRHNNNECLLRLKRLCVCVCVPFRYLLIGFVACGQYYTWRLCRYKIVKCFFVTLSKWIEIHCFGNNGSWISLLSGSNRSTNCATITRPGLLITGEDSRLRGHGFDPQWSICTRWIMFTLICCENSIHVGKNRK